MVTQNEPWGCEVHSVVISLMLQAERGELANVTHPFSSLTWMTQNQLPCSHVDVGTSTMPTSSPTMLSALDSIYILRGQCQSSCGLAVESISEDTFYKNEFFLFHSTV